MTGLSLSEEGAAMERLPINEVEVSITLPCLNEAETLQTCIEKAQHAMSKHNFDGEVIVSDNGSTDGSVQIAKKLGARIVCVKEKGYGHALMAGIRAARGPYIIMADADDSYDLTHIMPFLEKLRQGYDLVVGNRFKGGIKRHAMPFLHRYLGNPVLSAIGRLFFRSACGDFHCGMRGFKKDAILNLNLQTTGMEFASEMILKASLFNLNIAEVPINLYPDGRSRPPHLRTWRDGWRHLIFMLLYAPNWLFLYPGLLLIALGSGLGVWIWTGPKVIGNVRLDIHTLLYSGSFILIGFQAFAFSIFAKSFATSEELLPEDTKFNRLLTFASLDKSLILGFMLLLVGGALSIYLISYWKQLAFGDLDPVKTFRILIPAVFALILGGQFIIYGFFLGLLKLGRKRLLQ